jgi:tRNA threonylcarbamoyladenosine biosynthesis protein TsaB
MLIFTIRSDKPEAEIGLFEGPKEIAHLTWLAHRELSDTLHIKIRDMLKENNKTLKDLAGLVVFKGPGSFTGLRIGLSVANTFAYGLKIPIVARSGNNWRTEGVDAILGGQNDKLALPEYGAEAKTTTPKK